MSTTRLDRFLAHNLGLSRTEAQRFIRRGHVTMDGEPIFDPSAHVRGEVMLDDQLVKEFGRVILMLHKPAGWLSATRDPSDRTVLDLVPKELKPRDLSPVGRLDKDTTGLLLLTNDGQLNHLLTHPKRHVPRRYIFDYEGELASDAQAQVAQGLTLEDGTALLPAELTLLAPGKARLTLVQGVYHQVKRMVAVLGGCVTALHRDGFGPLELDPTLEAGKVRALTEAEIQSLEHALREASLKAKGLA